MVAWSFVFFWTSVKRQFKTAVTAMQSVFEQLKSLDYRASRIQMFSFHLRLTKKNKTEKENEPRTKPLAE